MGSAALLAFAATGRPQGLWPPHSRAELTHARVAVCSLLCQTDAWQIQLTPEQANLVADLSGWVVQQHREQFLAAFA